MAIIFSEEDLINVRPPCVIQSFINHNAVLYKVFVVGDAYTVVERPSLKNFPFGPAGEQGTGGTDARRPAGRPAQLLQRISRILSGGSRRKSVYSSPPSAVPGPRGSRAAQLPGVIVTLTEGVVPLRAACPAARCMSSGVPGFPPQAGGPAFPECSAVWAALGGVLHVERRAEPHANQRRGQSERSTLVVHAKRAVLIL